MLGLMHFQIRFATGQDAPGIRAIYAPFCERTAVSFETSAPSVAEMAGRIRKITAQFPWLVCVGGNDVVGYAYASSHHERAAYRWAANVAVYIAEGKHRRGIGRALYTALLQLLDAQGYFKACAGITLPNPGSVGLHEAMGFTPVGIYRGVGHKLGAWHDVGWWQLTLRPEIANPPAPVTLRETDATARQAALAAGTARLRG